MPWPKPIVFTRRIGPNYLWHLLAVARIGYDSDYAERFAATVETEHIQVLERYASRLAFANDQGGDLTGFFTFLPSWLHVDSPSELARYFEVLRGCCRSGSLRAFEEAFGSADWSDPFMRHVPGIVLSMAPDDLSAVDELSRVYMENYDRYADVVWPEAYSAMEKRETDLQAWADRRDYVAAWEATFSTEFIAPKYEIVLCYSNSNGPDYNSLGYSGNLFYYDKDCERTWQFVSHEVGTHLLYSTMLAASQEESHSRASLYRAYEVMAMFFNRRVLGLPELAYDMPASYRHDELLRLYSETFREGMSPAVLLRRGAAYLAGLPAD
jgi:hypothetical protein